MKSDNSDQMTLDHSASNHIPVYKIVLLIAFIFLAMNLRSPITSLPSVIDYIKSDLNINSQTVGLLSSIPVLCFGLLMPIMSSVVSKVGVDKSVLLTLGGIAVGILIRSCPGVSFTFLGTFIMGASITIGNLVSLMVISRDFRKHSDAITGVYVTAMSLGAMLTAGATAPMALIMGWQMALAVWSILAFVAIGLWLVIFKLRSKYAESEPTPTVENTQPEQKNIASKPVWKRLNVWLIALCFATHTFMFYSLTAWFPTYLQDVAQMSLEKAGTIASVFQIVSIIGCFLIPWLTSTGKFSRSMLFVIVSGSWFILFVGFLVTPNLWMIWLLFGGLGSGGGFLVVFMLVMDLSKNLDENRSISAFVQGIGYIVSSTGPTVIGYVHEQTGNWHPSFIMLSILALAMLTMGVIATKTRKSVAQ